MNNWINAPDTPEDYLGFVYIIKNETNNKSYIGQKKFWFTKTLPPLKGKKRKRKKLVESDWKDYTGSNEKLNTDIQNGHFIIKTIIRLCHSKFEMNYYELKEQIDREVLFSENYYNGIINVRISRPDKKLLEEWNRTKFT